MDTTTTPPASIWIIQNIRGDYNDEYYTPRSTQKFFLTEHEAVAALVPYHQSVAAKSSIAKRINRSDDPGALWSELVRFIHFPNKFSDTERESLAANIGTTPIKLQKILNWGSGFDNGLEKYQILELRLDADVPCSNGLFEADMLKDLGSGLITKETYDKELECHKQRWWEIEH